MMDTQIKDFTSDNFSASASASRFFAEHTDAEVQRKLNDLSILQTKTEATLRETVSENYGSFVRANAEIRSLGGEMMDLKELISTTMRLVQDMKSVRVLDAKAMRSSIDNSPGIAARPLDNTAADTSTLRIPKWVANASDELDRLIIEHQYSQAVVLINRTQDYYDTVSCTTGSSSEVRGANQGAELEKMRDISTRVREKGAVLAQVLKASIVRLPNSELWGSSELHRQLRLLIQLGYRKAAADGFAQTQVDAIKKALRSVDVSGDPGQYTTELSRVFFLCLERACKGFVDLFASSTSLSDTGSAAGGRPAPRPSVVGATRRESRAGRGGPPGAEAVLPVPLDVLSHLLTWLQNQIAVFASVLARQIQLGASEYADIMFERYADYYRSANSNTRYSMHRTSSVGNRADSMQSRMSRSESVGMPPMLGMHHRTSTVGSKSGVGAARGRRMSATVNNMLKAAAITSSPVLQHASTVASIAAGGMGSVVGLIGNSSKIRLGVGPLTFASDCLQSVFRESIRLDVLGLEGSSSLGWTLLPEIKTLIRNFTNDIIEEIGVQVQEDNWVPYREGRQTSKGMLWPPGVLYDPATQSSSRSGGVSRRSVLSGRASVGGGRSRASSTGQSPASLNAGSLSPLAEAASQVAGEIYLSASYVWVVAVMSEFLAEVWVLLQAGQRDATSEHSPMASPKRGSMSMTPFASAGGRGSIVETKGGPTDARQNDTVSPGKVGTTGANTTQYYSRDDICEIEPEIVSCLLRIIVRYVRDVESTVPISSEDDGDASFDEDRMLTEGQKECFVKTMEAVNSTLIPSLNDVVWANFFSDGSVLVMNPPKRILDRLGAKVSEIILNAKSAWGGVNDQK